jgi:hypothetical protein
MVGPLVWETRNAMHQTILLSFTFVSCCHVPLEADSSMLAAGAVPLHTLCWVTHACRTQLALPWTSHAALCRMMHNTVPCSLAQPTHPPQLWRPAVCLLITGPTLTWLP